MVSLWQFKMTHALTFPRLFFEKKIWKMQIVRRTVFFLQSWLLYEDYWKGRFCTYSCYFIIFCRRHKRCWRVVVNFEISAFSIFNITLSSTYQNNARFELLQINFGRRWKWFIFKNKSYYYYTSWLIYRR